VVKVVAVAVAVAAIARGLGPRASKPSAAPSGSWQAVLGHGPASGSWPPTACRALAARRSWPTGVVTSVRRTDRLRRRAAAAAAAAASSAAASSSTSSTLASYPNTAATCTVAGSGAAAMTPGAGQLASTPAPVSCGAGGPAPAASEVATAPRARPWQLRAAGALHSSGLPAPCTAPGCRLTSFMRAVHSVSFWSSAASSAALCAAAAPLEAARCSLGRSAAAAYAPSACLAARDVVSSIMRLLPRSTPLM
jgi:hypothetical protein